MKNYAHVLFTGLLSWLLVVNLGLHAQNLTLGPGAGASLAGGIQNTLLGQEAGNSLSVGSKNTMVGYQSGLLNTASENTFLGYHAGRDNTTGNYNTFLGVNAGRDNLEGFSNTFVGRSAGVFADGGGYNTFIGELTGAYSGGTSENTFVGYKAGTHTDYGGANTFIGTHAGESNTDGQENTFLGGDAGQKNTTGNLNAFGGRSSGKYNTTGSMNAFWGYTAGLRNKTGTRNTFLGSMAGEWNSRGGYNTYIGYQSDGGEANSFSTALGSNTKVRGSYSTAIGHKAYVHGSQRIVLGAIAGYNGSEHGTFVGIGKVTPNYLLHLGKDDAAKPGTNVWTIASDRRLKKDIVPFTEGLEVIEQIDPVRFHYNGKAEMPTDEEYVGIIAQDIQKIAPYMVGEFTFEDTSGRKETFLDYNSNAVTYLLINSVKELKAQNEALQAELQELRNTITQGTPRSKALITPHVQAKLWQNYPNPSKGKTTIKFEIPSEVQVASIRLSTSQGQIVKDWPIASRGPGQINFNTKELPAGPYLYQLLIDNQVIDSKKMILTR